MTKMTDSSLEKGGADRGTVGKWPSVSGNLGDLDMLGTRALVLSSGDSGSSVLEGPVSH